MLSAEDATAGPRIDRVRLLRIAGLAGWISSLCIWTYVLWVQQTSPRFTWLIDWHVYAAGARDFLAGSLYQIPLVSSHSIPIDAFNYPPLAAVAAVPFLVLPDQMAGTVWVIMNIAAAAATSWLVMNVLGVRHTAAWAGVAILAYTIHPWFHLALLGNNTPLVLFLVVAAVQQQLRGRTAVAGVVLGIAIGLKIWPIALLPWLLRSRAWRTAGISMATAALSLVLALPVLGLGVIGPAVAAISTSARVEPDNLVLGFSWLRESLPWWPAWGGTAAGIVLLAIPARGRIGAGLGILAGLAVIPNLWRSYLPSILVAMALIWVGITRTDE